jgi:ElaB/YqjD/DUF883 family membrane-anchored ribosome-binding protein
MTVSNGTADSEALRDGIKRTRAELGETVQALAAKADVKARLRDSAEQAKGRMRQQATQAKGRIRAQTTQTAGMLRMRAGRTAGTVRSGMRDAVAAARRDPAPWAVIAVGATAGAAIPVLMLRGRRR